MFGVTAPDENEYLISIACATCSSTSRNLVQCYTFPVNVIYTWYINCYCPRLDFKRIPSGFYNRCNKIFTLKLRDLLETFDCLLYFCLPLTKSGSCSHANHFGSILYLRCLQNFPYMPDSSQPVSQTQSGMDRLNCNYINQGKQ